MNIFNNSLLFSVTKVLVSGGYEARTEIINLEDEDLTCENPEDFPMKNIADSVGANLATSPVICGGTNDYGHILDTCSRLINGTWETFATMSNGRYAAAGVVHENTLHVFGGSEIYGGGAILTSTDIITIDGQVRQGENLPAPLYGHAMASVNSTTSIISGGYGAGFSQSPLTYYYNHLTQIFTSGPSLNQGRINHASGTVKDKKTKEKFVVVTGGYTTGYTTGYTDSTEILVDQHWQTGKKYMVHYVWIMSFGQVVERRNLRQNLIVYLLFCFLPCQKKRNESLWNFCIKIMQPFSSNTQISHE